MASKTPSPSMKLNENFQVTPIKKKKISLWRNEKCNCIFILLSIFTSFYFYIFLLLLVMLPPPTLPQMSAEYICLCIKS